ncbi:DmsE family decaheme c-type cytochrome [Alloacidobacterium dinghuense]|uniref:DmsE family decaheme c-type cytochrome n=2 Tax=Alloacidobacterium dinghuense TaxID=2763107 RepID=A0A7G8BR96_9BACT|nr:DmsE family decaheme c-type cytochrome [Alloacidobacterium dinghuense]
MFFSVALVVSLFCFWEVVRVSAAGADNQQTSPHKKANIPDPADFVGSETCETCHEDIGKKFAENPHSRLAMLHGGKGVTCESCHGPGREHVEGGGDIEKILRFSTMTPKATDEKCLECHAAAHPNFERSAHGDAGVSCTSCHSIHKFENDVSLLKVSQPKLCYTCHTDVKPAFSQPFHHKVDEGLIDCSDCHNPHGSFKDKGLHSSVAGDAVCVKCHTETAGPFVYEHQPIRTDGCTFCHSPHGSPNPRLLTRNNVNSLCLQCHSASMNFNAPGIPSFHNQAKQYPACTVCHVQIHGSNADSVYFR